MTNRKSAPKKKRVLPGQLWQAIADRKVNLNATMARLDVEAAKAGDTAAALRILLDFIGAIDQYSERSWKGPIEWDYARYLADCFATLLDRTNPRRVVLRTDADPRKALHLTEPRAGRRKGVKTFDTEALGASYWFLRRSGLNPERANKCLHEETGADRRTIQRASVENGNKAFRSERMFPLDDLKPIVQPYAVVINRILAAEKERSR